MQGLSSGVTNSELRVRVESEGAARVLRFPAAQTVWLGRDQTCDVVLLAQDVSRRHASLFVKDGELFVRDHSTYGTQVNGQPLQRALRSVSSPALVQLGPYRVALTLSEGDLDVRLVEARGSAREQHLEGEPIRRPGLAARVRLVASLLGLCLPLALLLRLAPGPTPQPTPALAERPCPRAPRTAEGQGAPSLLHAVQLLYAGDRLSALHAYRALAARDDSRAELSIVAELLARELSCQP